MRGHRSSTDKNLRFSSTERPRSESAVLEAQTYTHQGCPTHAHRPRKTNASAVRRRTTARRLSFRGPGRFLWTRPKKAPRNISARFFKVAKPHNQWYNIPRLSPHCFGGLNGNRRFNISCSICRERNRNCPACTSRRQAAEARGYGSGGRSGSAYVAAGALRLRAWLQSCGAVCGARA